MRAVTVSGKFRIFAANKVHNASFVTRGKPRPATIDSSPAIPTQRELLIGNPA